MPKTIIAYKPLRSFPRWTIPATSRTTFNDIRSACKRFNVSQKFFSTDKFPIKHHLRKVAKSFVVEKYCMACHSTQFVSIFIMNIALIRLLFSLISVGTILFIFFWGIKKCSMHSRGSVILSFT